jgi:hypothetical protein
MDSRLIITAIAELNPQNLTVAVLHNLVVAYKLFVSKDVKYGFLRLGRGSSYPITAHCKSIANPRQHICNGV